MKRRLGVALALAFGLHAVVFTLLHVRVGPAKKVVVEKIAPTEFETTNVALGESESVAPAPVAGGAEPSRKSPRAVAATDPVAGTDPVAATDPVAGTDPVAAADSVPATANGNGSGAGNGVGNGNGVGIGNGSGVGVGNGSGVRTGHGEAPVDRAALLGQILARVRSAKHYPEAARRRELEGTVHVRFTIGADGAPRAISTANADPLLEAAAKEAIERAAPLPVVEGPIELDVDYALND